MGVLPSGGTLAIALSPTGAFSTPVRTRFEFPVGTALVFTAAVSHTPSGGTASPLDGAAVLFQAPTPTAATPQSLNFGYGVYAPEACGLTSSGSAFITRDLYANEFAGNYSFNAAIPSTAISVSATMQNTPL